MIYPEITFSNDHWLGYITDHGNYIITVINRFLNYNLPSLLGIHVHDFQSIPIMRFLRGSLITSIAFILSLTAFINVKKTSILQPLLAVIFWFSIIFVLSQREFWQCECLTGFGRFIIADLIFAVFLYMYIKKVVFDSTINNKKIILISLFALVVGNISEVLAFVLAFALFSLLIYNNTFGKKIINNSFIVFPLITVVIGGLIMLFNPEYIEVANDHTGIITIDTIIAGLKDYKYFFSIYYKQIVNNHLYCYILIFILSVVSYVLAKRTKIIATYKINIYIPFFLLFGLLLFFMTFIISRGNLININNIGYHNDYWLTHHDFILIIRLVLINVIAILCSILFKCIEEKIFTQYILSFIFIVCITLNVFASIYYEKINDYNDYQKVSKEYLYILDKLVLNEINNQKIYLYITDKVSPQAVEVVETQLDNYFRKIYGLDFDYNKVEWVSKEDALKHFYENGGTLTDDELEKLKFQNLFSYKKGLDSVSQ